MGLEAFESAESRLEWVKSPLVLTGRWVEWHAELGKEMMGREDELASLSEVWSDSGALYTHLAPPTS